FEKLLHRIFIQKVWKFGIGRKTAKWLYEFLTERKFFVQIGKYESRVFESTSGVIPGSILGPTKFLIFINDIVDCVAHAMVLLFADDIKMLIQISTLDETRLLQNDINNVLEWSERNRLPFNKAKCNIITIRRTTQFHEATYVMGDHNIERKEEIRDLGLLVDIKMTLVAHMEQMMTSSRQSMGYIKWISKGQFAPKTLKVLFTAYVRSKLEFASVIWNPYAEVYRGDIESIQKQFVMYALGDTNRLPPYRLAPYEDRCRQLGLATLATRRTEIDSMMAYDLYNGTISDNNIARKFIKSNQNSVLRDNRLLRESLYLNDYAYNQPIARIIRKVNKFSDIMTLNRSRFKIEMKKRSSNERNDT